MTELRALFLSLAITVLAPVARAASITKAPAAIPGKPPASFSLDSLNPEQRSELNRQARIAHAKLCAGRGDILGWGQALFPEKFYAGFCHELHDYLIGIRTDDRTSTEAPRGHAKTTIRCFLIPIYQAVVEPKTYKHYLNVQATEKKALAINTSIKLEFEENRELRDIYGDLVSKTKWTDQQFVLTNGVIFTAVGAGQSIKGINYRNKRPDYILVDDLYDDTDIHNPEATTAKNNWFWSSLYPARAKGRKSSISILGTACNRHDLFEVLRGNANWKSRTFRAVKDRDAKLLLWPEIQSYDEFVADTEDIPTVIFNREFQNERHDDTSSLVRRDWLFGPDGYSWEFDPALLKVNEHHQLLGVIMGVDPSIGKKSELQKKKESDFTGIVVAWKMQDDDAKLPHYYLVDVREERITLDQRVELLQSIADAQGTVNPITETRIEGIGGFLDFVAEVQRRTTLPITTISSVPDKITHLENKSGFFEKRRVHVSTRIPKVIRDRLVEQLCNNFPRHDDMRDALLHILDDASPSWSTWLG